MSRRAFCLGHHAWVQAERAKRQECTRCPAVFPCAERCAHTDCEEATGKTTVCPVCSKKVAFEQGFHFSSRGKLIRVHLGKCQAAYVAEPEEPEPEQEQAI
jgi:hypothetical protein